MSICTLNWCVSTDKIMSKVSLIEVIAVIWNFQYLK